MVLKELFNSFIYEKGDWSIFICGMRGHVVEQSSIDYVNKQKERIICSTVCKKCNTPVYIRVDPLDDDYYLVSADFDYVNNTDGYLHI